MSEIYAAVDPKCNCVFGVLEIDAGKRFVKESLVEWAEEGLQVGKMDRNEAFDRLAGYGEKTCDKHKPAPEQRRKKEVAS